MVDMSNFEKERISREEQKRRALTKKEKQTDYYHAISKISYTALVVGVIVSAMQNNDGVSWKHIIVLALGFILTFFAYVYGNKFLK